jgi:putative N6-adenine-specific DNA methylase
LQLIATCPEETKGVLEAELRELGATDIAPLYRALTFQMSEEGFYDAHLRLRTASRIFRVLREGSARTPEMLFDQARRVPWPKLFDVTRGYLVEGVPGDRDGGMRANDISRKVREAIEETFRRAVGRLPKVDLEEPKVVVVAFLRNGRLTLSLDTAGKALHKRGYRLEGHPAPIKETLASAILRLAGYDGTQALLDPMCGSGTIAIEAAQIALRKPPQMHRKKGQFLFEWLNDFDRDLWRQVQERARLERLETPPAPIVASDINETYVGAARRNALRARVERDVTFRPGRFEDATPPAKTGILVANLPYGERLSPGEMDALKALYGEIGNTLKRRFAGWRAVLLAAEASPYKFIGLKPSRRIPLANGSIPCKLLVFDLYEGKRTRAEDAAALPMPAVMPPAPALHA